MKFSWRQTHVNTLNGAWESRMVLPMQYFSLMNHKLLLGNLKKSCSRCKHKVFTFVQRGKRKCWLVVMMTKLDRWSGSVRLGEVTNSHTIFLKQLFCIIHTVCICKTKKQEEVQSLSAAHHISQAVTKSVLVTNQIKFVAGKPFITHPTGTEQTEEGKENKYVIIYIYTLYRVVKLTILFAGRLNTGSYSSDMLLSQHRIFKLNYKNLSHSWVGNCGVKGHAIQYYI